MKNIIKKIIPNSVLEKYHRYQLYKLEQQFIGSTVHCTICGSHYREFGPYGNFGRKNALCFHCGSLERHRLYWLYFNNKLKLLEKEISVLHFAPAKILFEKFSSLSNIKYTPCDLNTNLYNYKNGPEVVKVNIESIPFEAESFDFILCSHVLEHVPNDKLAMSELFRVMKKGGAGIIQVPIDYKREFTYEDATITDPLERTKAFGQHDHLRMYGRDYKNKLEGVGFKVVEDNFVNTFSSDEQYRLGLSNSEFIYYCSK